LSALRCVRNCALMDDWENNYLAFGCLCIDAPAGPMYVTSTWRDRYGDDGGSLGGELAVESLYGP